MDKEFLESTMALSTCAVSQYVSNAQHLGTEDANSDEELRYNAESSPQVFGRDLTQIHGHHIGRETCRWEACTGETKTVSTRT